MTARPATPDPQDDREPVARWENEGGACGERATAPPPGNRTTGTQDGDATDGG